MGVSAGDHWFQLAADRGVADARRIVEVEMPKLTPEQVDWVKTAEGATRQAALVSSVEAVYRLRAAGILVLTVRDISCRRRTEYQQ